MRLLLKVSCCIRISLMINAMWGLVYVGLRRRLTVTMKRKLLTVKVWRATGCRRLTIRMVTGMLICVRVRVVVARKVVRKLLVRKKSSVRMFRRKKLRCLNARKWWQKTKRRYRRTWRRRCLLTVMKCMLRCTLIVLKVRLIIIVKCLCNLVSGVNRVV